MTAQTFGSHASRPLIARLPGLLSQARQVCGRAWRRVASAAPPSCVFHITHHKAGSQWVRRVLEELTLPWVVRPRPDCGQFLEDSIRPRHVYPTLYITREQFESVNVPPESRRFVVIRDLRDTLVSAYFSLKISHQTIDEQMVCYRSILHTMGKEAALIRMIRQVCTPIAEIQRSWLAGEDNVLKYEDLLSKDKEILSRVLLDHCRIPVRREVLTKVAESNRFEVRTGGRKPGAEEVGSHERKGIAGDWRNHFTDKVAKAFKERYGELLIQTGYESNDRW